MKNRGQSLLAVVMWAAGISVTVAFGAGTIAERKIVRIDDDITALHEIDSATTERVAKLEEAIATIKSDSSTIKADIKTLLRGSQ